MLFTSERLLGPFSHELCGSFYSLRSSKVSLNTVGRVGLSVCSICMPGISRVSPRGSRACLLARLLSLNSFNSCCPWVYPGTPTLRFMIVTCPLSPGLWPFLLPCCPLVVLRAVWDHQVTLRTVSYWSLSSSQMPHSPLVCEL